MKKWTEPEIRSVEAAMLALCEVHGKQLTEGLLSIYMRVFQGSSAKAAVKAIEHSMLTNKWFPKPVEFLEIMQGSLEEKATNAWTILNDTLTGVSPGQSIIFEDTRISACVDFFGGWEKVCQWQVSELHYRRAEFVRIYKGMVHEPPQKRHIGALEHANRVRGYLDKIPDPIMITNERRRNDLALPPPLPEEEEEPFMEGKEVMALLTGVFK